MDELPSDIIEDCQDIYSLFAKEPGLKVSEVGKCLRMLNLNPSEQDLKNFKKMPEFSNKDLIDFEDFVRLYKICKENCVINEEEVRMQIAKLEKDQQGKIKTKDLKELLMSGEEPLNNLEAEALLEDFDMDGVIEVEAFLTAIMPRS